MNCLEFRQLKLSDPYTVVPEADAHRDTCANCERFEREIGALDGRINEALSVPVPENLAARILLDQSLRERSTRPTRLYWLGLAASFLLAAVIFVYRTETATALPAQIAAHLDHEQGVVGLAHEPVTGVRVHDVLAKAGFTMESLPGRFVYARTCVIEGMLAAHLVVEEGGNQFTVLVLPKRAADLTFREGAWRGVIASHGEGSFAVVGPVDIPQPAIAEMAARYSRTFPSDDS